MNEMTDHSLGGIGVLKRGSREKNKKATHTKSRKKGQQRSKGESAIISFRGKKASVIPDRGVRTGRGEETFETKGGSRYELRTGALESQWYRFGEMGGSAITQNAGKKQPPTRWLTMKQNAETRREQNGTVTSTRGKGTMVGLTRGLFV